MANTAAQPTATHPRASNASTVTAASNTSAVLAEHLTADSSTADVIRIITELIRDGVLSTDERLPTLRALSERTGLSRSMLGAAWSALREAGLIETRRRGGSFVLLQRDVSVLTRNLPFIGWQAIDFTTGHAHASELPDLGPALLQAAGEHGTNDPGREFITEHLRSTAARDWPFVPEAWTTVGGSSESTVLAVEAATAPDGVVAVAEPTSPGTAAALRGIGMRPIAVTQDAHGPIPSSLRAAIDAGAQTFLMQSTGALSLQVTPAHARIADLAAVITESAPQLLVIEDDALGPLATQQDVSFGEHLAGRVIRLRSYCRGFGVDLRTTIVGGPARIIARMQGLRSHGTALNSRILQNALAHMLDDEPSRAGVRALADRMRTRRMALQRAVSRRGLASFTPEDPMLLWIPAADEQTALARLSASGIMLSPSAQTFVSPAANAGYLRIAVPQLPDSPELVDQLADLLADAVHDDHAHPGAHESEPHRAFR